MQAAVSYDKTDYVMIATQVVAERIQKRQQESL